MTVDRAKDHSEGLKCGDCGAAMALRFSAHGLFYGCVQFPRCRGSVGAHPDGRPLGVPADEATRRARILAHAAFDRIWKQGAMKRSAAYAWMRQAMGLREDQAHVGQFDEVECARLVDLVRRDFPQLFKNHWARRRKHVV